MKNRAKCYRCATYAKGKIISIWNLNAFFCESCIKELGEPGGNRK